MLRQRIQEHPVSGEFSLSLSLSSAEAPIFFRSNGSIWREIRDLHSKFGSFRKFPQHWTASRKKSITCLFLSLLLSDSLIHFNYSPWKFRSIFRLLDTKIFLSSRSCTYLTFKLSLFNLMRNVWLWNFRIFFLFRSAVISFSRYFVKMNFDIFSAGFSLVFPLFIQNLFNLSFGQYNIDFVRRRSVLFYTSGFMIIFEFYDPLRRAFERSVLQWNRASTS